MVEIRYQQRSVHLRTQETVLDGLLRAGVPVSYSCRSGSCQVCMLRSVSGEVPEKAQRGLKLSLRELGYFLPCLCRPERSLDLEPPDPEHVQIDALVVEKIRIGPDLCMLRLELPFETIAAPGQHLRVVHPDGESRSYSIASLPEEDYFFEVHVARVAGGKVSNWLIDEVAVGADLQVLPPAGRFGIDALDKEGPLLMVATGTGLAPLLPMLRRLLEQNHEREIHLLHGAADRTGLYADSWLRDLARCHPRFHYLGCCSREAVDPPYRSGRVLDLLNEVLESIDPDDPCHIVAAGHPDMLADLQQYCIKQGIDPDERLLTDAFEFEHVRRAKSGDAINSDGERRVPPPDPELWAQLGNGRVLSEVLRQFYAIAFADEHLGPYFEGVTQARLREKQYSFLRSLILGTRDYFGQRPRNAHHWMVVSDWLFDYRLDLMADCLRNQGVAEPWIRRWHAFEEFFRADIVKSEPVARTVGRDVVPLVGVEDTVIDEGALCDGCGGELAPGDPVRFHLQLGRVYCHACASGGESGAGAPEGD